MYDEEDTGERDRTQDKGFQELLRRHRLRSVTDAAGGGFKVESESGSTYAVRCVTKIARDSGSMYFQWECTCPARRRCRHIDACEQIQYAEAAASGDYDGMDVIERTC